MENEKEIINWFTKSSLDYDMITFSWVDDLVDLEAFDYEIRLRINGIEYTGRGLSTTREVSLAKAISEAIERYASSILGINKPVSIHYNKFECKNATLYEGIERHVVLSHINELSIFNFRKISISRELEKELNVAFDNTTFYSCYIDEFDCSVYLCIGEDDENIFFSSDCSSSKSRSIEKISLTLLANVNNFKLNGKGNVHLDPKIFGKSDQRNCLKLDYVDVTFIELKNLKGLKGCPLYFSLFNSTESVNVFNLSIKSNLRINPYRHI